MAFSKLDFSKLWTVSDDKPYFPTVETDETQVREDMQYLFNEIRDYINVTLLKALESLTAASNLGATDNSGKLVSVQALIDALERDQHTHSNKSLLDTYQQTEASLKAAVQQKHEHGNKNVLDGIEAVSQTLGASPSKIPSEQAVNDALAQVTVGGIPVYSLPADRLMTPGTGVDGQHLARDVSTPGGFRWVNPPAESLRLLDGTVYQAGEEMTAQLREALSVPENGLVLAPDGRIYQAGVDKTKDAAEALGVVGAIFATGTTPPTDTRRLWIDTTDVTGGLKYYNGTAWDHVPVAYAP